MGFLDFFKKKGGQSKNADENPMEFPWIEASENPWNVRLLDLRPLTQTVLSVSSDSKMAENAVSYGGATGQEFWGIVPENAIAVPSTLSFLVDEILYPGVLFTPNCMEHKWAVFFDGENIIFVRSWQRQVMVVAKTRQENSRLDIETISGNFSGEETPEKTEAILNFILLSHALGEVVPTPLPIGAENLHPHSMAQLAFSQYGRFACFGVFDETFKATTERPLRTFSLLHIAAAQGDVESIERLAAKYTNLDFLSPDGSPPLAWSLLASSDVTLKKLLELGADPNGRTHEGATPIMNAVQENKAEMLTLLLASGADVNATDNRGFTALHRACEMGLIESVKLLLEHGADKNILAEGHSPLSLARLRNEKKIIDLLNT